jgi:pilus assembly protein FimV
VPNTDKRNPFKATVLAAALAFLPLATNAAGLGKITVLSALGQPLKAELEVTANRDEALSLVARVASIDAFRQAGIEYSPALVNLRFSKEIKERGGRRFIEADYRSATQRALH